MATIEAFPLTWPIGWPRTPKRRPAAFQVSFARARDQLLEELRLMNARGVVISSNIELRRDGLPYANRAEPSDPAIAVYFIRNGIEQCIPCDRWSTTRDNLRAIGLTVANLRAMERYATGGMVDAAFRGFAALPETPGGDAWWDVLGISPSAPRNEIDAAWKRLVKQHHPDVGGDADTFRRLTQAYEHAISGLT